MIRGNLTSRKQAPNSQTPQTPTCPHYPQTYPQPGDPSGRPGTQFQTPQTPKLHKQMSMITGFNRPGSQVNGDAGIWT